ncbi:hypothetical protein [Ereboglobus luteus]|uniref:Right handed beta helix domain-containing protein n=1 Tax=Ereboglobus luteus TaxID=1796921 RepID=A0A2U8E5U3_9BACT|nr:hypothetical protein [Ereboglobus luteus]AWI10227.1 hypothetical protein CKA38_14080 [Ereboglobus luteus]
MHLEKTFGAITLACCLLTCIADAAILRVDRRGGADFTSLRAAAAAAKAGDTIQIAKGSGPYREMLFVEASGTEGAPIIIEGNGELVTGFEPLRGFKEENGRWVCDLPRKYPCVITYQGERLVVSAKTNQPTRYATFNDERTRLILLPGTMTEGWEISSRGFAVRVYNSSHHVYRNIRASGSLNDAFNLHGKGTGLVFENIEGFHNLDEGFSAHDEMHCRIKGGKFWGNDNGLANIRDSKMEAEDIDVYANLGFGFFLTKCMSRINGLRAWDNGITQIYIGSGCEVSFQNATAYHPAWAERQLESYFESRQSRFSAPVRINADNITGKPVTKTAPRPDGESPVAFIIP